MKKIPTIFLRDPLTNFRTLTDDINLDCMWVYHDEGEATAKYDGTAVLLENDIFYGRYTLRRHLKVPNSFVSVECDENTGKTVGWIPIGDGPEWKWHREAIVSQDIALPGTYELCGPKIQSNPHKFSEHILVKHGKETWVYPPPSGFTKALMRQWIIDSCSLYEGVVWHHEDGRMAKIKRTDFGLDWPTLENE